MTKGTIDYSKGSIYQIVNDVDDEVYVGSTCDKLTNRFHGHRGFMKKKKYENIRLYQHMREIGIEHFRIELIEYYPCNTKEQLHAREGHFIRERATLNKRIEGRTVKEILERQKQYNTDHKEEIAEYKKQYHKDHRDAILEQQKQYYENNKDKILKKMNEKCECPCGGRYTHGNKSTHFKSKKHIAYKANQQRTT
jgi:hypothetical protein